MAWRPLSSSTSSSQCQTLVPPGLGQPGNVLRALKVHVRGFVLKDAPADALATAVRRVLMESAGLIQSLWRPPWGLAELPHSPDNPMDSARPNADLHSSNSKG